MDNKWDPMIQPHSVRHTCWQMLAYLARTFAFSAIARGEGQPSAILSTQRHLAKSQPSFLYWAQRSERPSNPEWNGSGKNSAVLKWIDYGHVKKYWNKKVTLCGRLSICTAQARCAFVHLYAQKHNTFIYNITAKISERTLCLHLSGFTSCIHLIPMLHDTLHQLWWVKYQCSNIYLLCNRCCLNQKCSLFSQLCDTISKWFPSF